MLGSRADARTLAWHSQEEVQAGLGHDDQNVYTIYEDPQRNHWQAKVLPALKRAPWATLVKGGETAPTPVEGNTPG